MKPYLRLLLVVWRESTFIPSQTLRAQIGSKHISWIATLWRDSRLQPQHRVIMKTVYRAGLTILPYRFNDTKFCCTFHVHREILYCTYSSSSSFSFDTDMWEILGEIWLYLVQFKSKNCPLLVFFLMFVNYMRIALTEKKISQRSLTSSSERFHVKVFSSTLRNFLWKYSVT